MGDFKIKGTPQRKIANKTIWLKELAKDILEIMQSAIKILPMELTGDSNLANYFNKFGAYPFIMDQKKYEDLHNIFKKGFQKILERYPDDEEDLDHSLIIKGKVYPEYDSCGIYAGTDDIKLAKKL